MAPEGTLIVDGEEHSGIEFIVNSAPDNLGKRVVAGSLTASTAIIEAAVKASELVLDGEQITVTGNPDENTISFKPVK